VRGARPGRALESALRERVRAESGEVLVAATSGGPDSAALAALLAGAAEASGARLVLAHVNHGVRPGAWQDEAVVLALGATFGARVVCAGLEPGPSDEARLRAGRYARLAELTRAAGGRRLFTAHHAEDQTETVLLALFRGSGPAGLAGMPAARRLSAGLTLERPLLDVPRSALWAYAAARHLPVARDPSNAEAGYRRNALRRVLADLRRTFPHLDEAVARHAAIARGERDGSEREALRRRLRGSFAEVGHSPIVWGNVPPAFAYICRKRA